MAKTTPTNNKKTARNQIKLAPLPDTTVLRVSVRLCVWVWFCACVSVMQELLDKLRVAFRIDLAWIMENICPAKLVHMLSRVSTCQA